MLSRSVFLIDDLCGRRSYFVLERGLRSFLHSSSGFGATSTYISHGELMNRILQETKVLFQELNTVLLRTCSSVVRPFRLQGS